MTNEAKQNDKLPRQENTQKVESKAREDKTEALRMDHEPSLQSLIKTMSTFSSEVDFASHAFSGNVENVQNLLEASDESLKQNVNVLKEVLENYKIHDQDLQKHIATIALLPRKTQEALKKLVPDISNEIAKVHDQRMSDIVTSLKALKHDFHEDASNQMNILKDLSEMLQKQVNEDILQKQKTFEKLLSNRIEEMNQNQLQLAESQGKIFQKFVDHTKHEVESVTSNHGTKFIRNMTICLIFSVIAGATSGWYINKYFPRFVTLEKTGSVTIHHSNVNVREAPKVNIPKLKKK